MMERQGSSLLEQYWDEGDPSLLESAIFSLKAASNEAAMSHDSRIKALMNLGIAYLERFREQASTAAKTLDDVHQSIQNLQQALGLAPSGHPDRPTILDNLADSLLSRFDHTSSQSDLDEAIAFYRDEVALLVPSDHETCDECHEHINLLARLAHALSIRFEKTFDAPCLDECITTYERALSLSPTSAKQLLYLSNDLAGDLATRFDKKMDIEDLDRAIALYRQAINLKEDQGSDSEDADADEEDSIALELTNIALLLLKRFDINGDEKLTDLEEVIQFGRRALAIGHESERWRTLNVLGNALLTKYKQRDDPQHLDEAVLFHTEALQLQPHPNASRALSLNNLSVDLISKFNQSSNPVDLENAINYARESLELRPTGAEHRDSSMTSVANGLVTRFKQTGDAADLDEAIALHREALSLPVVDKVRRSTMLDNLCSVLLSRFDHSGNVDDVNDSIRFGIESLALRSPPHPDRTTTLLNISNAFMARFEYQGRTDDLSQSVNHSREGLECTSPSHSDYFGTLISLSNALLKKYHIDGEMEDLEESLRHATQALLPASTGTNVHRFIPLLHLGVVLRIRFEKKGDPEDLSKSIQYLQEAMKLIPDSHPTRSLCMHRLAQALWNQQSSVPESQQKQRDIDQVLSLYEQATKHETGSISSRLLSAQHWALTARSAGRPDVAMTAYCTAISILPTLSPMEKDISTRRNLLSHIGGLGPDSVNFAIEEGHLEQAVVFYTSVQSFFWSQGLQMRTLSQTPRVGDPDLPRQLLSFRQEPNFGVGPMKVTNQQNQTVKPFAGRDGADHLIDPSLFKSVQKSAARGPIIFLIAHTSRCDALILTSDSVKNVQLAISDKAVAKMVSSIHVAVGAKLAIPRAGEGTDIDLDLRTITQVGSRTGSRSQNKRFRSSLKALWDEVVYPIVSELKLEKTDSPKRIWWHPSGPFAFLPLHAAGIYPKEGSSAIGMCLSDYAISSYCSNLQDLAVPPTVSNEASKVLAVIQPEIPGFPFQTLRQATTELETIQLHVPNEHLTSMVGTVISPTTNDQVLSSLPNASIVHFGCHGYQHPSNPLDSFLLLSGGRLTMRDLVNCKAKKAGLAYLSACQTAMGDIEQPDQYLHLAASMIYVGFKGVVGTMWEIADEDAPIVTGAVYKHLYRNGPKLDLLESAHALHLAAKDLRSGGRDFIRWVPFVHYGV